MQNQQAGNATHPMPPLSEKDLSYIKDHLNWELVAAKKTFQYAHQTVEKESRELLFHAAQQHQQNIERLMQHLSEHVSQTLQASVAGNHPSVMATQG